MARVTDSYAGSLGLKSLVKYLFIGVRILLDNCSITVGNKMLEHNTWATLQKVQF